MLHALYENGQMRPQDVETHIRDEIEREAGKIAEVTKKVKQTYKSVRFFHLHLICFVLYFSLVLRFCIDREPGHRGRHALGGRRRDAHRVRYLYTHRVVVD